MKKLLSLMFCFGLVVGMSSIVGCSDDKKPSTPPAKDAPAKDGAAKDGAKKDAK